MKPFSTSRRDRYCRLFAPRDRPTGGNGDLLGAERDPLTPLVATMVDDRRRICQHWPPHWPEKLINAGYTYFGQFLHHDLTDDSSTLAEAQRLAPEEIRNEQLPRFDLANLYGTGPFEGPHAWLYEPGDVRLKVTDNGDLANTDGVLCAADRRAAENVILRQMTAFFARLHNCAIEQWRSSSSDAAELFDRARRQMCWQFQRLIYEDYLPRLLDPDIYREVFIENSPRIEWEKFSIPVEFSAAAMRFGHSMVRAEYFLSRKSRDLTLLELAQRARDPRPLEREWLIEWGEFFQNASEDVQAITVRPIDTKIAAALHELPLQALHVFNSGSTTDPNGIVNLPLLTLLRGAALQLPSGQLVAESFGESPLTETELASDCAGNPTAQGHVMREHGFLEETPLFFYLLKEAEVRAHGNHLGRTGSRIVAEVFHAARRFDGDSYIHHAEMRDAWPIWQIGGKPLRLESLGALFSVASELN